MKRVLGLCIAFLVLMSTCSLGQKRAFTDVPLGSRPYRVYASLVKTGFAQPIVQDHCGDNFHRGLTRYEFAVAIDRLQLNLRYLTRKHEHFKNEAEVRRLVRGLVREFRPEIRSMHGG